MVSLIELRFPRLRDCWYLHLVGTVQAFLVIAGFLQRLSRNGHREKKFFLCLSRIQSVEDGFCLVRTTVIDRNCSVAQLALPLLVLLVVATTYSRHPA